MPEWKRGATQRLMLMAEQGVVTGEELIRCDIKKAVTKNAVSPGDDVDPIFSLDVEFAAADDDLPARWYFTAGSTQTASLAVGKYVLDARIVHATGVISPSTVLIEVVERVTKAST